ncbi:MAG: 4'-phosphopantetheinyl transferase family protein [Cyanophyceae cyanobacterium]
MTNDSVHAWRANLDVGIEQLQSFMAILSADEKQRAEQFYFSQHSQRFIVGRGLLRSILGQYLKTDPAQLEFEYGPRGKPMLASGWGRARIQFNLSHSQGLALYGFSLERRIGVDLEYLRPVADAEKIVQRFFSAEESAFISRLPLQEKHQAFYRGWTSKEAYLKATGEGLAGLEQVEVSLSPQQPACLLRINGDSQAAARWSIQRLSPAANYLGAIAVEGHNWQLSCWQALPSLSY